jgi:FMN phosphatase YigB (HAD superfamily)
MSAYYEKMRKRTTPMIIGLDFDNTLVYSRRSAVKVAAKDLGIKVDFSAPRDYNFSGYPEVLRKRIYELFRSPEFSCDLEIVHGAQEKLREWNRLGHRLVIITARDLPIREATDKFIRNNFEVVDEVHYVDMSSSKVDKFKELKIDVWIDDSPIDAPEAVKLGIKTCLISNSHTPYNNHLVGDRSIAIKVYDKISSINF